MHSVLRFEKEKKIKNIALLSYLIGDDGLDKKYKTIESLPCIHFIVQME